MCTFVVLHRVHAELPLLVGSVRDEFHARPSEGPQVLQASPRIVGGRDLQKGGTWSGVTAGGLFVGLTNQRSFGQARTDARSRGEAVLQALAAGSAEGVRRWLQTLDGPAYNPFNLLVADGREAFVAYVREAVPAVELEELPPGVHALHNDRLGAPSFRAKAARTQALAQALVALPRTKAVEGLAALLGDHALPGLAEVESPPPQAPFDHAFAQRLHAICIHTPLYGTRSAAIAAIEPGRVLDYRVADGAPCTSPFVDRTALLYG